MAISPTGRWLVSGHDSGDVWLWNLESLDSIGRPHRLPGPLCHHNDTVRAVAISAPIEIETETGTPVSTYCWLVSGSDTRLSRIFPLTKLLDEALVSLETAGFLQEDDHDFHHTALID